MLFELINQDYTEMQGFMAEIADEMFKNLRDVKEIGALDQIQLRENGAHFYSKLFNYACTSSASWQVYSASVIFGVANHWA